MDIASEAVPQGPTPEQRIAAFLGGSTPAPAPKAASPAAEATVEKPVSQEPDDEAVAAEDGTEPAEQQQADDGEEPFEELTHLDKTYEVPASLKKAFEENRAMATRSAQAAKQAEALAQQVNAQAQFIQAETQFQKYAETEMSEKVRLEAVLNQYKKLDWYAMSPEQYAENRRNRDILAEQLSDVEKTLEGKRQEYQGWRTQQYQEVVNSGKEYLRKVIPNYSSDDVLMSIAQQAISVGFSQAEVANMTDPRLVVALHKAAQWDKLQSGKSLAQKKVGKATPVVKPGASTSSNSTTAVREKALRARLKQTGNVNDMAALLIHKMR